MSITPTATVDVPALTSLLDGRYAEVRQLVRAELAEHAEVLEDAERLSRADYRQRVLDVTVAMAKAGRTGLGFPEEYGGGADVGGAIAAFETLGTGDLSVLTKIGVQFGLFGGAILHLGTKPHHDEYLRALISGDLLGCFAMSETGHGSNVQELQTTATYDAAAGEFVVHTPHDLARKDYIGNAAEHGRLAVVFAQLVVAGESRGVHALVVPIRDEDGEPMPGVRIEDCGPKIGLNGVDNGRLWFDQVRVPRTALLNRYAAVTEDGRYHSDIENPDRRFFTMLGTLVQGRVSVGGAAINASKVALTIAIRYGLQRRQFGPPGSAQEELLLDYGMHRRRLFPLLARTYALHFAQERLVDELHRIFTADLAAAPTAEPGKAGPDDRAGIPERDRRALESRAAGTKALGTWHASRAIQTCREACGGAGYLSVNRFDALRADTDVFTTFEGDNTILLQLVAKGLLTDYRDEFSDLDQIGMVRFVASLAVETVLERTRARTVLERLRDAVPSSEEDPRAGLLDPDYHRELLCWREEHMLGGVARRLKRGVDQGGDPVEVFSDCQDHVIGCAWAHGERLLLEAFSDKVAALDADDPNRPVLRLLCNLYALSCIEADRGWFLEHGRLSNARAKAVTAAVNDLCAQLRPVARQLVDAFAVPEEILRAEII